VLELSGFGSEIGCSFAATRVCPTVKQLRKRVTCDDWTPNKSFSNSNRHFVVGDVEELSELASYLANVSPHMAELLAVLPDTFDELNSNVRENSGYVNSVEMNSESRERESFKKARMDSNESISVYGTEIISNSYEARNTLKSTTSQLVIKAALISLSGPLAHLHPRFTRRILPLFVIAARASRGKLAQF